MLAMPDILFSGYMTTRMILLRHGDPGYRKTFVGPTDYDLRKGVCDRAKKVGAGMKDKGITAVYTSKLKRAMHTGDCFASGLETKVKERFSELNEISFGKWENLTFEEVEKRFPGEQGRRIKDLWNYNGYQGESMVDVKNRVMPIIEKLFRKHEGETFVVACHGVVTNIIRAALTGIPMTKARKQHLWFLGHVSLIKKGDKFELEEIVGLESEHRKTPGKHR